MASYSKVDEASHETSGEHLLPYETNENQLVYTQRKRSRWSLFRSWFGSFSLGVLFASTIFIASSQVNNMIEVKQQLQPNYKFADNDALPEIPNEQVTFQSNPTFSERPSDDTDYSWNILLPPGRGFVYVPDSSERGLPRGQKVTHGEIYSVAMYHQLHCLARMRKMHWIYLDAITTGEMGMAKSVSGRTQSDHVRHCIDYLRQSILCSGDMTLEWPKMDGPSSGVKVDGWNVTHTCKSPSAIDAYMDKYHFNESSSFDAAG